MIRVIIADDHAIVRRGLRDILSEHPDLEIAGEAPDYGALLEEVRRTPADVAIIDIKMPGGNILDALGTLRSRHAGLPVLVMSSHPEDQFALRLIKAGASGYVVKESAPDELVAAIRLVVEGRRYIGPGLADRLAGVFAGEGEQPPHTQLSDREFQVLVLIASGKTVSEIAGELFLSVKTVSTYRSRILTKMGMATNAEITRYAFENGLVD